MLKRVSVLLRGCFAERWEIVLVHEAKMNGRVCFTERTHILECECLDAELGRRGVTSQLRHSRGGVFFFQAEDGIRDLTVTGVQTCALPIYSICAAAGLLDVAQSVRLRVAS